MYLEITISYFLYRDAGDLTEYECHLEMDVDILSKGVAYKYCVLKSRYDNYEYLHGLPSPPSKKVRNRFIKVQFDQRGRYIKV